MLGKGGRIDGGARGEVDRVNCRGGAGRRLVNVLVHEGQQRREAASRVVAVATRPTECK